MLADFVPLIVSISLERNCLELSEMNKRIAPTRYLFIDRDDKEGNPESAAGTLIHNDECPQGEQAQQRHMEKMS